MLIGLFPMIILTVICREPGGDRAPLLYREGRGFELTVGFGRIRMGRELNGRKGNGA